MRVCGSVSGWMVIVMLDVMWMDAGNGRFSRAWFKSRLRVRRKDECEWMCDGIEDVVVCVVMIVDDVV